LRSSKFNSSTNTYEWIFDGDELGKHTATYKYTENGQSFYTTFQIEVVESIIEVNKDFIEIEENESIIIDLLSNDHTSANNLNVISIPNIKNGKAEKFGNLVEFTPDLNFTGLATFNYVVQDDMGETATGFASVHVRESDNPTSVINEDYFVQVGEFLDIVIPSEMTKADFSSTSLGKLSDHQEGVLRFNAGPSVETDNINFNHNGQNKSFNIHVLPKLEDHGFIRDDIVYTSMNQTIQFDVFTNDLEKSFQLVSASPELKRVSPTTGELLYTAPTGFQGVKNFYYQVSDGSQTYIGNIEIVINDNLPQTRKYEFTTLEGTPFLIDYKSDFQGEINVNQAPKNGIVRVRESGFFYCGGQVQGNQILVYDPNDGFIGEDEFEIQYCSNNGTCVTVEATITIESSNEDCNCIGEDCIWPGDTDNDGIVSVKDILPIGLYMGEMGPSRTEVSDNWNGAFAQDWEGSPADANGDGMVTSDDVAVLEENYSKVHSFLRSEVLSIKDVPFYAVPRQETGSAGDLMLIDIFVGTEDRPLLESNGIAFNFSIPPVFIQDNLIEFQFTPAKWFGYNNPTISTVQYPEVGRIDAAISRVGGVQASGHDEIGTVGVVLQDDVDWFRAKESVIPIDF
ncbi:MAG: Ig-like domain-containing protein, partial [Bacteroidota bacterium]